MHSCRSLWYFLPVASTKHRQTEIQRRRPLDKQAAKKLDLLMSNAGLSPEVIGAQTGVSGKQIRNIIDDGIQPERRIKYALARRFDLLPADIWKADAGGLAPAELNHLRDLARRSERVAA